jgi:hypothetical protein
MNKIARIIAIGLMVIIGIGLILEVLLTAFGYEKSAPIPLSEVNCKGEVWKKDSLTGFSYESGEYECDVNGHPFTVTQLLDGSRKTSDSMMRSIGQIIDLYGCSVTWGHGISNNQTMAWKLQENLSGYKVRNFGIGASSTLQALLLLQRNLATLSHPTVVILNYGSYHDMRNTFTSGWQTAWQNIISAEELKTERPFVFEIPVCRKMNAGKLSIEYWDRKRIMRRPPWIEHSVLMNQANTVLNYFRDRGVDETGITKAIILEINKLCQANNIGFMVGLLTNDKITDKLLISLSEHRIATVNLAIDLRSPEFNLMPYDGHPNEHANNVYSERLLNEIKQQFDSILLH